MEPYFKVQKDFRLNPTNCFIMKVPKKRRFQRTTINYFSDIYFEEFTSYF